MKSITAKHYSIFFNTEAYTVLNKLIETNNFSKIIVLTDTNTKQYCLPELKAHLNYSKELINLSINPGEDSKHIDHCLNLWNSLNKLDADKKTLLINLGGGVITDLGGFIASTFKRGIRFINIPTSLLGMVDAAIGGKTGINLGRLKNQVGTISFSELVLIDTKYLKTLSKRDLLAGFAEMLKHGLIHSKTYWKELIAIKDVTNANLDKVIYDSVFIKHEIVTKDTHELGLRKALNYGHTLGHAIESYFLDNDLKEPLFHGEAVAIGLVLESYISCKILNFSTKRLKEIKSYIKTHYKSVTFNRSDYNAIINLLKYDKKNTHGQINFVLLKDIGEPQMDCQVSNSIIVNALDYYNKN